MYLRKITKIQNVGKFHKGGISGGEYDKYTLFYAGNGRGKTTLCAILRSLKTGSATIITDRQTLGEAAAPEVQLLMDTGVVQFAGGKWNAAGDALHIFDSAFITENVHAGEAVNTDHRRSLYRIIVGTKGVQLAEEVDTLDAKVTDITAKITAEKKVIQQHVPPGLTVEQFLALVEDVDIDKKIAAQDVKIKAADQSADIAKRGLLTGPSIPAIPAGLVPLLEKTIAGISADAATKLDEQLAKHKFEEGGEAWVSQGLQHLHGESCPFCAASIKDNPLVSAYQQFFDAAYEAFKSELVAMKDALEKNLSEVSALKTQSKFEDLAKEVDYWRAFGAVDYAAPPSLEQLPEKLSALSKAALEAISAKIASPLEKVPTAKLDAAEKDWDLLRGELQVCNAALVGANTGIQAIKAGAAKADKAALEKDLAILQASKKRFAPEVKALADNYIKLIKDKANFASDKEKKKEELDAYDGSVLPKYHNIINSYLELFGAGFRLMKSEKNYVGKIPQWHYTIEINKHAVEITTKPGFGEASFQTAMSAGDKSTLALAFFLAQLDLDPNLKDAIVVFDDPFTSLDDFRRVMTAKTIFRIGQSASQVIILSHDKHFLKEVSDKIVGGAKCGTFQISSSKNNSAIEAWDLEREVKEGYLRDHMVLQEFHDGTAGEAKAMRTLMRPLLEKYIRYRFPNQIPDGKWLGDMLAIIDADADHPLKAAYKEIDDINQYTAPYHHDPNEPFNEDEVKTFVGRTLAIVGGS